MLHIAYGTVEYCRTLLMEQWNNTEFCLQDNGTMLNIASLSTASGTVEQY